MGKAVRDLKFKSLTQAAFGCAPLGRTSCGGLALMATPPGMTVRASVTLDRVDGRMLWFQVEAFDEKGLIGKGSHQRAIINVDRFVQQVRKRAGVPG